MRLNPLTSPWVSEGGPIVTAAKGLCWCPLTPRMEPKDCMPWVSFVSVTYLWQRQQQLE